MLSLRKINPLRLTTVVRKFSADQPTFERSLNQVQLIGRTGNEPEKRGTDANPVIVFSLATSANFKTEDGTPTQKVDWHRVCVFKPTLRDVVFTYMKKGQRVYVSGRISYGDVTEESTGRRTTITSIIADDIIFFKVGS